MRPSLKPPLLLATTNPGKVAELRDHMGDTWDVKTLADVPYCAPPEETGATFEENARLKAAYYCRHSGLPTLSDDSGLCVKALGGAPGLHSARYADNPDARLARLLVNLRGLVGAERSAHFVCSLALAFPGAAPTVEVVRAELHGRISEDPYDSLGGLEYDRVFLVNAARLVPATVGWLPYVLLSAEERARVSPRAVAVRVLRPAFLLARMKLLAWAFVHHLRGPR